MKTHAQPIWRMAVLSFCLLLSAVSWGQTSTTVETVTENLTLSEPGEYHITATEGCIADGVTIDITSKDAWLFFDNLRPSQVIGQWLSRIKVDGEAAGHKRNVFVNIYGNGAAVVPHTPNDEVLTVYTGEMYEGRSYGYKPGTYTNLGSAFNNAIRSFKLKRGYMAIMAQGSGPASGYSRCFIAQDKDIEIPNLADPKVCTRGGALYDKISYIRVMRWQAPTKKSAIGYNNESMTDRSWYYNYAASDTENQDQEYVGMLHHIGWDNAAYETPRSEISGNTHMLFFNEPWNNADGEGKLEVGDIETAYTYYSNFKNNGSRLGSMGPQMGKEGYMIQFLNKCDQEGVRVDFIALHLYQWQNNAQWWANQTRNYSNQAGGRPVWITEWNNGPWPDANWEDDSKGPEAVGRNLMMSANKMKEVLQVLEDSPWVERYALFNFSGNTHHNIACHGVDSLVAIIDGVRRVYRPGDLFPAGEVYQNFKSKLAYNPDEWEYIPPYATFTEPSTTVDEAFLVTAGQVRVYSKDNNGEYFDSVLVEKKLGNSEEWQFVASSKNPPSYGLLDTWDLENPQRTTYRVSYFYCNETTPRFTYEQEVNLSVATAAPIRFGSVPITKNEAASALFRSYESEGSLPILGGGSWTKLNDDILQGLYVPTLSSVGASNLFVRAIPWGYFYNYSTSTLDKFDISNEITVPYLVVDSAATQVGDVPVRSGAVQGVSGEWVTVTFKTPMETAPLVFPTVLTSNNFTANKAPVYPRVRNITNEGFELRLTRENALDEADWAAGGETVAYFAIPEGDFTVPYTDDNGNEKELHLYTKLTEEEVAGTVRRMTFDPAFPVVPTYLVALQTSNDDWCSHLCYSMNTTSQLRYTKVGERSGDNIPVYEKDRAGILAVYTTDKGSGDVAIDQVSDDTQPAIRLRQEGNELYVETATPATFRIYTLDGQLLLSGNSSEAADISSLSAGQQYLLSTGDGEGVKFIKE